MATATWNPGASGDYLDPAHWAGGTAPGPGDTATITGGATPVFSATPPWMSSYPAPPGEAVSGQSLVFSTAPGTYIQGISGNTTFAADATIQVAGSGTTVLNAWFGNAFDGRINVGDGTAASTFQISPTVETGTPAPTNTNRGTIAVASGSTFSINPFLGRLYIGAAGRFFTGQSVFDNEGTITAAPGGVLSYESANLTDNGAYPYSFVNNGTVRLQGAEGQNSLSFLETAVAGNGSIVVDGRNAADPARTQLYVAGGVSGGTIDLRDASLHVVDTLNNHRVTGGALNFEDGHSFLLVQPGFESGPPAGANPGDPSYTQSLADPFGMAINGFRAGDTIAIEHVAEMGDRYAAQWDQASHHLTVTVSNGSAPATELAQFTLNGTYGANDFAVTPSNTGDAPGKVATNDNGTLSKPPQIDITTHQAGPPNFGLLDTTTGAASGSDGEVYTGPVDYLQWQYIWAGQDSVNVSAAVPNAFLKGGPGNDALAASGGSNVLDGNTGSNFLVGATGADGGTDTFFVDGRGSQTTWSTAVNFHHGDAVTLWGFDGASSTYQWAAQDGAAGYQGATIHAQTAGAGTGTNASLTFAGVGLADAQSKFAISTGSVGGEHYMYVAYTG